MAQNPVGIFDRVISVLTYLTGGFVGLIVCILFYFGKKPLSHFLKFNIYQSIFLSLLLMVISIALDLLMQLLHIIPFVNYVAEQISFLFNRPWLLNYSFIQFVISVVVLYLIIYSAMGKYPRIYKLSKIIDYMSRG